MKFGFCGPSYQSQSLAEDAQSCINLYLEHDESGTGKSEWSLLHTPGLSQFATLPGMNQVRNVLLVGQRLFAVGETLTDQFLFELNASGTVTSRGQLGTAGFPATMAYNQANQLLVCSGTRVFAYDLINNVMVEISTSSSGAQIQGPVSQIGYTDGYFIALLKDSQKFQISNLLNGAIWNPLDIAQVSLYQDNIVSMLVTKREIWFFGPKKTVVYVNTGDNNFPFSPASGSPMDMGTNAQFSPINLDNTTLWIGANEDGSGQAWRANGYTPQRISTHAIETAWQSYPRIDDAIAFTYQDQGHPFWVIRFPSANKTWVYDVAAGQWHERSHLTAGAHLAACHALAFGKHLVGDWNSGNIYEMSVNFLDDAGTPIKRVRRTPYIFDEGKRIPDSSITLGTETGLGPSPDLLDGNGEPREPQAFLRWSNDGAHTWSNHHARGLGKTGEYKKRVRWNRLGQHRGRVYELSISDPIPVRLFDAYKDAD